MSTLECQEGVPSQGGQQREEHRAVQHVQVEHFEGHFKSVRVIVTGPVGMETLSHTHSIIPNLNSRLVPVDYESG